MNIRTKNKENNMNGLVGPDGQPLSPGVDEKLQAVVNEINRNRMTLGQMEQVLNYLAGQLQTLSIIVDVVSESLLDKGMLDEEELKTDMETAWQAYEKQMEERQKQVQEQLQTVEQAESA